MNFASVFTLLTLLISTVFFKIFHADAMLLTGSIALSFFMLFQWRELNTTGRVLLIISIGSLIYALLLDHSYELILKALSRAGFFASFLVSIAFLKLAAKHSEMVSKCGKLIVNQPPSIRYGVISYGSYLFGTILSFGTINLVGQVIEKGNSLEAAGGDKRVQNIRRRRMSLALQRGFSTIPLASPFSISMILILASIPGLNWQTLLPVTLVLAMALIGLGWLFDFITYPKSSKSLVLDKGLSWIPLLQFILLAISIFTIAATMSHFTTYSLPLSILIISPFFGLAWLAVILKSHNVHSKFLLILKRDLPSEVIGLRSEMAIICGATIVGMIGTSFIPQDSLVSLIRDLSMGGVTLAIFACFLIPVTALLGFSPLISVTILASTLAGVPAFEIPSEILAVALLSGWALALNISPIALSSVMIAKVTGCTPKNLSLDWNLSYSIVGFGLSIVWVLVLASY